MPYYVLSSPKLCCQRGKGDNEVKVSLFVSNEHEKKLKEVYGNFAIASILHKMILDVVKHVPDEEDNEDCKDKL